MYFSYRLKILKVLNCGLVLLWIQFYNNDPIDFNKTNNFKKLYVFCFDI